MAADVNDGKYKVTSIQEIRLTVRHTPAMVHLRIESERDDTTQGSAEILQRELGSDCAASLIDRRIYKIVSMTL